MKYRFEEFEVWQDTRKFIARIYKITRTFPIDERFGLTDQLRRAATSIALNIAEGSDRRSDVEFRRYLRMSLTSLEEVVSGLYISLDLEYLKQNEFDELYGESHLIAAKLNAFIKQLSAGSKP